MEELRLSAGDKQDARIALLKHYSTEGIVHSIYLLALTLALLSFIEFTSPILEPLTTLSGKLVRGTILSLMTSSFIVLFVYVLGRTVFWGYMRLTIINVKPKENTETYDPKRTTVTFLQQLHEGCLDYVKAKHGVWARFYGLTARLLALIWLGLFIACLMVSLVWLSL